MDLIRAIHDPNPNAQYFGDERLFKSSPSAPAAPDPYDTAAAQTTTNKETALWNASLNNINQVTPYGDLTYTQNANTGPQYNYDAYNTALNDYNEAFKNYQPNTSQSAPEAPTLDAFKYSDGDAPSYTSTITLSPEQQAMYDTQVRSQTALGDLGEQQLGRITDAVSTPYSYGGLGGEISTEDIATQQANAENAYMSRLNPQFAQDEEALRTRLINQGIGQGSQAYQREMDAFNQMKNDARSQAVLAGQQYGGTAQNQALQRRVQSIDEYNAQRNAPLNEYIGMTSGVQIKDPSFSSQGYQGANTTDIAGLINQDYENQMAQYNAAQSSSNNMMSGLMGLGGSFLGGPAGGAIGSALFKE